MPIEYDFEASVSFWLGASSHLIEQAMTTELAKCGITLRQVRVLACLVLHGDLTQTRLAQLLGVEPSSVVRVLDRMERDGWIERHADPSDRRQKLVRTTEKVAPHWQQIVTTGEAVERRAIKGLTEQDLDQLRRTLNAIRGNLETEA